MPLYNGRDSNGPYFQWGLKGGKRYYYKPKNVISQGIAKAKAMRQARAIEASKHRAHA